MQPGSRSTQGSCRRFNDPNGGQNQSIRATDSRPRNLSSVLNALVRPHPNGLSHVYFDAPQTAPVTHLLVNIDHIATLRNARREVIPDPAEAARLCEDAGADGIVFHLRQDRRHINDEDVVRLKESVRGKLDFELSLAPDIVDICCATVPELATLVPERREEVTTEGGIDVIANKKRLSETIPRLYDAGIAEVALFVDPIDDHIDAAAEVGANCIELHTGSYANAMDEEQQRTQAEFLANGAARAHLNGLKVHAGHGLSLANYTLFQHTVPYVEEVSIGFAIVSRAIAVGIGEAVREMLLVVKHVQP